MKKALSILVALCILASICVVPAFADAMPISKVEAKDVITVTVDGKKVDCASYGQEPVIVNGRTLVPLRSVFETLGAQVEWDNATRSVKSVKGEISISLAVDSKDLIVNGMVKALDVPAQIMNDRTMVPVRAVAEAFGAKVDWDNDNRCVVIKTVVENVGVNDGKTPADTVKGFFGAIKSLDFAKAIEYLENASSPEYAQLASIDGIEGILTLTGYGNVELTAEEMAAVEEIVKGVLDCIRIEVTDEKITSDTASVTISITAPDFESIDATDVISQEEAVKMYEKVLSKYGYNLNDFTMGTITSKTHLQAIKDDLTMESLFYMLEYLKTSFDKIETVTATETLRLVLKDGKWLLAE